MASLTTGRRWYSWLPLVGDPQPHRLNVILGSWLTRLVILGFIQWGYERVCSDVLRSLQFLSMSFFVQVRYGRMPVPRRLVPGDVESALRSSEYCRCGSFSDPLIYSEVPLSSINHPAHDVPGLSKTTRVH